MSLPVVITGAGGRVGRLLQRAWALHPPAGVRPLWSARREGDLPWDIDSGSVPPLPEGGVIVHLAGATRGPEVTRAATLAREVCRAARAAGVAHVFLASSAAVLSPAPHDLTEEDTPDPRTPYGAAKRAMEEAVAGLPGVTLLRIGNVIGADTLSAAITSGGPVSLDPVSREDGGPLRSAIGPVTLLAVLAGLARLQAPAPPVLNLAAGPPVRMADLLEAAGADWSYGPPNPGVVPRVTLDLARLRGLVPVPDTSATGLIAEWRAVGGPS